MNQGPPRPNAEAQITLPHHQGDCCFPSISGIHYALDAESLINAVPHQASSTPTSLHIANSPNSLRKVVVLSFSPTRNHLQANFSTHSPTSGNSNLRHTGVLRNHSSAAYLWQSNWPSQIVPGNESPGKPIPPFSLFPCVHPKEIPV
eukprot:GFKZ01001949.1.p1 GENE.GFKZ01001949.1~~GFKZ01001949.1.p1  ORF type:complete len:147 (+),score=8.68 GFKZ01001949.1:488-928(+)